MIIIDTALQNLENQNKPLRVGLVGAGFMAKGVALQIIKYTKGMRLSGIANRHPEKAGIAFSNAGVNNALLASSQKELNSCIEKNIPVYTDDPNLLTNSPLIDIIVEVTGTLEYSAGIVLSAIKNKKHVAVMNSELDGTLGPILKVYAEKENVIYSNTDGDQPGVEANLLRFVSGIGVTPILAGNIKGLQDPYRTPLTQKGFAEKWGQAPYMVTSFADGSKISFEQTVVANAFGFKVAKRGMHGFQVDTGTPLLEAVKKYNPEELLQSGGIVDYLVGPEPNPGVFVLGTIDDPIQKHYLNLYKLGEGPLYLFYTPYHLCHFEIPNSIARICIFKDAVARPVGKPYVEVVAVAKKDLKKGEQLDGIGNFTTYGVCENSEEARKNGYLPQGLSQDCVLKNDIKKDEVITFNNIILPKNRLIDRLWNEQLNHFSIS